MDGSLFGSDLWKPALDKYAEATGLSVELFDAAGQQVLDSARSTPLVALFRECGFEPGLFAECARRCLNPSADRAAVAVAEAHGLTVVGTSLVLEGAMVARISMQGPEKTYTAGQMFYEQPGATHEVSKNASQTQPAKLLAMIFAKKGSTLTTPGKASA